MKKMKRMISIILVLMLSIMMVSTFSFAENELPDNTAPSTETSHQVTPDDSEVLPSDEEKDLNEEDSFVIVDDNNQSSNENVDSDNDSNIESAEDKGYNQDLDNAEIGESEKQHDAEENKNGSINITENQADKGDDNTQTGSCGDYLQWTFTNGVLTISGSGAMTDWAGRYVSNEIDGSTSPFCKLNGLNKIIIEEGVTSIGDFAFYSCRTVTEVELPQSLTSIGDYAFRYCDSMTINTLPDSVTSIGDYAFYYCKSMTIDTLPDNLTSIGNFTFFNCSGLYINELPGNLTAIGDDAFCRCSNIKITNMDIPDSVCKIGRYPFSGLKFKRVIFPRGIKSLSGNELSGCSVDYVFIPNTITEMNGQYRQQATGVGVANPPWLNDKNTFYNCTGKKRVYCEASSKPSSWKYGWDEFLTHISYNASLEEFLFLTNSYDGVTKVEVPEGVTTISDDVFRGNTSIEEIVLPSSVTRIMYDAFRDCSSLSRINIPNSVTRIENHSFSGCSSLEEINIPNSVTTIDDYAFSGCSSLEEINIPNSVTTIGGYAFSGCSSLKEINIPNSVTNINSYAFAQCTSLEYLELPNSVKYISDGLCSGCTNLKYFFSIDPKIEGSPYDMSNPFEGCNEGLKIFTLSQSSSVKTLAKRASASYYNQCSRAYYDYCRCLTGDEEMIAIPPGLGSCNLSSFSDFEQLKCIALSLKDNAFYSEEGLDLDYLYIQDAGLRHVILDRAFVDGLRAFYCDVDEETFASVNEGIYENVYERTKNKAYYGIDHITDITKIEVAEIPEFMYKGANTKLGITLEKDGIELVEGRDYQVNINTSLNDGLADICLEGMNNYYGQINKQARVILPSTDDVVVTKIEEQKYTGRRVLPKVSLRIDGDELEEGIDYTTIYRNNTNIGTATIEITLADYFSGSKKLTTHFKIVENNDLSPEEIGYCLTLSAGVERTERYFEGEKVQIQDMNDIAYKTFVSWKVVSGDLQLSSAQQKTNPLIFTMPASDVVVQASYSGKSLNEELQEENSRHNAVVSRASRLKANIELYTGTANNIKNKYGIGYLSSSSYYNTKANNTASQLSQKQQRLSMLKADTAGGHQLEINQLEKEIKNLQADYQMYLELKSAAEYQEKADKAQQELNKIDLNAEAKTHNNNIASICKRHGVKDTSVAEIKYIRLDKEEYDYTGKDIKPVVTVIDSNGVKLGTESYTVVYPNDCKSVGEHIITLNLKGNYVGTKEKTFTIVQHNYGDWVITKEATCTQTGSKRKICKDCGRVNIETIPICHKWNTGKVTQKATATAVGKRLYTCTLCGHQETRSDIPKAAAPTGKVTILNTVANSAKKTNDVIWDKSKVTGANNYEIQWRTRGSSNWKSTTVGNTVRGVTTGLTIGGLYEIRVRPFKAATDTTENAYGAWSPIVYRYFFTTQKIRLTSKSKGTFTMSWAKDANATSYQVLYTTNKNGSGAAQNIKTAGKTATSITVNDIKVNGKVQNLQSGKTYYVQVREVRNVGGKNYIGNISCPVAVKVK